MQQGTSFSRTAFSRTYFALQAAAVAGWWLVLWRLPERRALFLPPGASEPELLAFWLPDLAVAAAGSLGAAVALAAGSRWAVPASWLTAGAMLYSAAYCLAWAMLRDGGWLSVALMTPAAVLSLLAAVDASAGVIDLFRQAAAASRARHVAVTLLQIALFWSFFLYVAPAAIAYVERELGLPGFAFPGQAPVAAVLFLLSSGLGLFSGITMARLGAGTPFPLDAPNRLVVAGPYACLRNPMIVAGLAQGTAVGLAFGSFTVLGYVLLGGLLWQLVVRPAEEAHLAALFGDEYAAYRASVPCWFPRRRPYRSARPVRAPLC